DLSSGATPVSTYMEKGFAFVEMLADKGYLDVDRTLSTAPNNDVEPFLAQEGAFVCGLVGRPGLADAEFATAGTAMPVLDE
ncbi:carbohydrate ABC transporter substrate-binding protein, partial [Anaerostipes caccae]|nr:carbohydrate ABC transporter substrate-binding protein [Anaerostipes caccae]